MVVWLQLQPQHTQRPCVFQGPQHGNSLPGIQNICCHKVFHLTAWYVLMTWPVIQGAEEKTGPSQIPALRAELLACSPTEAKQGEKECAIGIYQ